MSFELKELTKTKFYELNHSELGIDEKRVPNIDKTMPWKCAFCETSSILFTQLVSSSAEMRDDFYYYLMLVDNNPIFILHNNGQAGVLNMGEAKQYELAFIIRNAIKASSIITANQKPIIFKDPKKLYDGIYSQL